MHPEGPGEPWKRFLDALAGSLDELTELHCIGGFAMVQAYGLARATADVDVVAVVPGSGTVGVRDLAGQGSDLHRRTGVYLDVVLTLTKKRIFLGRTPLCAA